MAASDFYISPRRPMHDPHSSGSFRLWRVS